MSILVVEDEVGNRMALVSQLESLSDEVIPVKNAAQAYEAIQAISDSEEATLDLAVIDLRLPGQNGIDADAGFQIIERLQQTSPNAPIIVVTVRNDREAWESTQQYPSVHYFFTKPWMSKQLKEAARDCLQGTAKGLRFMGEEEEIDG